MGFWKKIIDKIKGKKTLEEKIEEKNIKNSVVSKIKQKSTNQKKFDDGLKKSSSNLSQAISEMAKKFKKVDEEFYEQIEEILIMYDVGTIATTKIIDAIRDEINFQNVTDPKLIKEIIVDKLFTYYIQDTNTNTYFNLENDRTNVILVTGVNGVGKTTSIAKIAYKLKNDDKKVLLVAGDTFRAGAIEQLKIWAKKIKVDIVYPQKENITPDAIIYQGLQKAYSEKYDVVICDTSGRLNNKINLMKELEKINSNIKRFDATAPHEVLLVIDATMGQSGINQAKVFKDFVDISGIILTKMDGTSKGGIVLSIKDNFNIPVKYIGLGESIEDLSPFDLEKFIIGITKEIQI